MGDRELGKRCLYMHRGSFTIEASIYVPVLLMLVMTVLSAGIHFFQESKVREDELEARELDIVQKFYTYEILGEIGEEVFGD